MKTTVREAAFQIALRDCSKVVVGKVKGAFNTVKYSFSKRLVMRI